MSFTFRPRLLLDSPGAYLLRGVASVPRALQDRPDLGLLRRRQPAPRVRFGDPFRSGRVGRRRTNGVGGRRRWVDLHRTVRLTSQNACAVSAQEAKYIYNIIQLWFRFFSEYLDSKSTCALSMSFTGCHRAASFLKKTECSKSSVPNRTGRVTYMDPLNILTSPRLGVRLLISWSVREYSRIHGIEQISNEKQRSPVSV